VDPAISRAEEERQLGSSDGAGALAMNCVKSPGVPLHFLKLRGALDSATAPRLDEELARIEHEAPSWLVIDLSGLRFIDSTGLGLLLSLNEGAEALGISLRFVRGRRPVERLLKLTGAEGRLPFLD
jgi:anti-sigma B factor antagonist